MYQNCSLHVRNLIDNFPIRMRRSVFAAGQPLHGNVIMIHLPDGGNTVKANDSFQKITSRRKRFPGFPTGMEARPYLGMSMRPILRIPVPVLPISSACKSVMTGQLSLYQHECTKFGAALLSACGNGISLCRWKSPA